MIAVWIFIFVVLVSAVSIPFVLLAMRGPTELDPTGLPKDEAEDIGLDRSME